MAISPDMARSLFNRVQYANSELALAPAPIVTTFPGDTSMWQQSGAVWTVVDNDKLQMNNQDSGNNFLNLIYGVEQAAPAPITLRVRASGSGIASGLGNSFGLELTLTDSGGLSGTTLSDVTTNFPAGTWPEAEFEVTATAKLPNPSSSLLAPLSTTADASSTLQAVPYYLSAAYLSATGTTTPGASEDSITPGAANAYDIQFGSTLSTTDGTTGILLGMGTASGQEAQYAKISASGVVTYIGANAAGVSVTVAGSTLNVTISAPPTDTSTAMPSANTATVPAYYLYAYVFARNGIGEVTVSDIEVFQSGTAAAHVGTWQSGTIDSWRAAGLPMTGAGLGPEQIGFYYGDPSNVDNRDSVTHSIQALSQFTRVVLDEPGLLTTARQQAVANGLIAAGVKLYAYTNIGVAESDYNHCIPPVSAVTAIIDRCAAFGYAGVFFDAAGHGTIPTEYLNYLKAYAAGKSPALSVFANAHPQDCLDSTVDTSTLTAPTTAPVPSAAAGSTALAAGTYTFGYTLTSYDGETTLTPTADVTITAGQQIDIARISANFDSNTQGISLYMSEAAGSATLRRVLDGTQGAYEGAATTITALPSGAAPTPPAANTAYVSNPYGIASTLGPGDWCLWESFYSRSDDQYAGVPEGGFAVVLEQYVAATALAHAQNVQVAGLAYALTSVALSNTSEQLNAYLLAAMLGWDGVRFGAATSTDLSQWGAITPPRIGTSLVTPVGMTMVNASPMEWYAETDEGVIWFSATDSPATRASGHFAVGAYVPPVAVATPAVATAVARTTVLQEGSSDASTWTPYDPQLPRRYVRLTATLES